VDQDLNGIAELIRVSKSYGDVRALEDLTIKIGEEKIVSILGPNGSGKSTLLKLVSLQLRPTSGRLTLFGKEILKPDIKRQIGYLAHESFLYGELSVSENLEFYLKIFSVQAESARDGLNEVVESLDIRRWLDSKAKNLSYGSRRRVDIARALIHRPRLLALDEPFSGLDPQARKLVIDNITDKDRHRTVLLSLQDVNLARAFSDEAIVLREGTIAEELSFR
jgi:ABC-2 type transport system ATP-binding protein